MDAWAWQLSHPEEFVHEDREAWNFPGSKRVYKKSEHNLALNNKITEHFNNN